MSTTIDIIPVNTVDISFEQVLQLAEQNINNFIASLGLAYTVWLRVDIRNHKGGHVRTILPADKFEWEDDECACFFIDGIEDGINVYCRMLNGSGIDPQNPWWWLDEIEKNNKQIEDIQEKLACAKVWDMRWFVRLFAGRPGIIAVAYGLIGASIAQLTGGLLYSDDGGWDYERFPAEYESFLDWYFRPEKALEEDMKEWASRCIAGIEEELINRDYPFFL